MKFESRNLTVVNMEENYSFTWTEGRIYQLLGAFGSFREGVETILENPDLPVNQEELFEEVKELAEAEDWDYEAICAKQK